MATTRGTTMAGKAQAGQGGGKGKGHFSLMAKLGAGAAVLGCVAALMFGALRAGDGAQVPAVAPAVASAQASGIEQQQFLAWNLVLPDGTLPTASISVEQQHFLAWNTQLPDGTLPTVPVSVEQRRFLDLNTQLPSEGAPALIPPGPTSFPGEKY